MKNIVCSLMLLLSAGGCVSIAVPPAGTVPVPLDAGKPFAGILPGMKQTEVAAMLDGEATIGFEADAASGEFKPIRRKTLVSSEILEVQGSDYQIDMYLPRLGNDGSASAAQSAVDPYPFIYKNGVLIGKGAADLEALRVRAAAGYAK